MSDVNVSPDELLRIIGELEVTRRVHEAQIEQLHRSIEIGSRVPTDAREDA